MSNLERLLKHDRAIVMAGLVVVIALSWAYLLSGAGMNMPAMDMTASSKSIESAAEMSAMTPAPWSLGYAMLIFVMWHVMMIAMMTPSAAPMRPTASPRPK